MADKSEIPPRNQKKIRKDDYISVNVLGMLLGHFTTMYNIGAKGRLESEKLGLILGNVYYYDCFLHRSTKFPIESPSLP